MSGKRVVIKVGTSTLAPGGGAIDLDWVRGFVSQVAAARDGGTEVIVVSSGAIAAGVERLGLPERPADMPSLQAAAAVGQVALVECYAALFAECDVAVGQMLLTRHDTGHREAFLHARDTLDRLLSMGAVPIINENDTVAVDEIRFSDNDTLAALVAVMAGADLVVLLSDIDGLYDADPRSDDEARLLEEVEELTDDVIAAAGGAGTPFGSGGMATKVEAGRVLMKAGIPLVICDGRRPGVIGDAIAGRACGTTFSAGEGTMGARKLWIALGRKPAGEIVVDDGAKHAVLECEASLLPAGVVSVAGAFREGDAVVLKGIHGEVIGRGLTAFGAEDLERVKGMKTSRIAQEFPHLAGREVVHRDSLAVL